MFLFHIPGLIWSEIKQLWDSGPLQYINDMWNIIDFITNSLYVATVALRIIAYLQVMENEISNPVGNENLRRLIFILNNYLCGVSPWWEYRSMPVEKTNISR